MENDKRDPEKIAKLCKQVLEIRFGNMVAKCDISNEDLWARTKQKEI
jgi:hypothetical protein